MPGGLTIGMPLQSTAATRMEPVAGSGVSGGGKRGHSGGVVRAKPRIAYGDEWPRLVARAFTAEEAFVMSFLRHRQIYQSDLALD